MRYLRINELCACLVNSSAPFEIHDMFEGGPDSVDSGPWHAFFIKFKLCYREIHLVSFNKDVAYVSQILNSSKASAYVYRK